MDALPKWRTTGTLRHVKVKLKRARFSRDLELLEDGGSGPVCVLLR